MGDWSGGRCFIMIVIYHISDRCFIMIDQWHHNVMSATISDISARKEKKENFDWWQHYTTVHSRTQHCTAVHSPTQHCTAVQGIKVPKWYSQGKIYDGCNNYGGYWPTMYQYTATMQGWQKLEAWVHQQQLDEAQGKSAQTLSTVSPMSSRWLWVGLLW